MRVEDIPPTHHAVDAVAGGAIVATLMGWLPPVAAFLSILWFGYQIYDMWDRRRHRRLAALDSKRGVTDACS